MSTNKSEHYDLHLWEPEDAFVRAEFNENSTKVDAALHGLETGKAKQSDMTALQTTVGKKADKTALTSLQQYALTKAGIAVGTYTGDGQASRYISVPGSAVKAVLVEVQNGMRSYTANAGSWGGLAVQGGSLTNRSQALVTVSGSGFYVYNKGESTGDMNLNGFVYHYVAFQ